MSVPRTPVHRARPPLSETSILATAMALADAEGTGALSMRRIADRLGVKAMSLYNHVANKDAILDGIVELALAKVEMPPRASHWRTVMHTRACSLHAILLAHPWVVALTESRITMGPVRLALSDAVIETLRGAGFSVELAYNAFLLVDSYIYGFALQEVSWVVEPDQTRQAVASMTEELPMDRYPHLMEVMEHVAARAVRSERATAHQPEFEFGLDLILDGLEAQAARCE